MSLLIVKGAGICSLYHKIHYIEIRYIEVWVYFENNKQNLSSHLDLVILENSQFFACYLSK